MNAPAPSWDAALSALPTDWLRSRRWFQAKSDNILGVQCLDVLDLTPYAPPPAGVVALVVAAVEMADGTVDRYLLPLALEPAGTPPEDEAFPLSGEWQVREALGVPAVHTALLRLMEARKEVSGRSGVFRGEAFPVRALRQSRPLAQTSTNSLVLVKGDVVIKYFRRLQPGESTELEMNRFLLTHGDFEHLPPLTGAVGWRDRTGTEHTLLMAQLYVESAGDLWHTTQEFLGGVLDELAVRPTADQAAVLAARSESYFRGVRRLAEILAHLHRTLAAAGTDPRFAPEPIGEKDLDAWSRWMSGNARAIFERIVPLAPGEGPEMRDFFRRFPRLRERILSAFSQMTQLRPEGWIKCRVHGDFHLGQVLDTGADFLLMDFEGEPLKAASLRAAKYSPLKDVAGLLRSYNYAIYAALFAARERYHLSEEAYSAWEELLHFWNRRVETIFLDAYWPAAGLARTSDAAAFLALLKLEKAVYELDYEINNRPGWLPIPMSGIGKCLDEVAHA
jgi:maltose alpha-D-glucosyltransferase/alpha-amylase